MQKAVTRLIKDATCISLATLEPNEKKKKKKKKEKKCGKVSARKEIFSSEHLFEIQQDLSNKQRFRLVSLF